MNKRTDIEKQSERVVEMYSSGKSTREISSLLFCCKSVVVSVLRKSGVIIKGKGRYTGTRYKTDENFFESPDLINSYWAGFIAADGCVVGNRLKISISNKDKPHLEKFRDTISPERPIRGVPGRSHFSASIGKFVSGGPQGSIEITSEKIVGDLYKNFGISEKKSLTIKPPKNLSLENSLAFIVGYIDGDGSMGYSQIGKFFFHVVGTQEMVEFIFLHLKHLNPSLKSGSVRRNGNTYSWSAGAGKIKDALRSLYLFVYGVPFMERKWDSVWL